MTTEFHEFKKLIESHPDKPDYKIGDDDTPYSFGKSILARMLRRAMKKTHPEETISEPLGDVDIMTPATTEGLEIREDFPGIRFETDDLKIRIGEDFPDIKFPTSEEKKSDLYAPFYSYDIRDILTRREPYSSISTPGLYADSPARLMALDIARTRREKEELVEEADKIPYIDEFPKSLSGHDIRTLTEQLQHKLTKSELKVIAQYIGADPELIVSETHTTSISSQIEFASLIEFAEGNSLFDRFLSAVQYIKKDEVDLEFYHEIFKLNEKLAAKEEDYPESLDVLSITKLTRVISRNIHSEYEAKRIVAFIGADYEEVEASHYSTEAKNIIRYAQDHAVMHKLLSAVIYFASYRKEYIPGDFKIFTKESLKKRAAALEASQDVFYPTLDQTSFNILLEEIKDAFLDDDIINSLCTFLDIPYVSIEDRTYSREIANIFNQVQEKKVTHKFLSAISILFDGLDLTYYTKEDIDKRRRYIEESVIAITLRSEYPKSVSQLYLNNLVSELSWKIEKEDSKVIAAYIGADYDSLEGDFTHQKITSLIEYANEHSLLDKLLSAVVYLEKDLDLTRFTQEYIDNKQKEMEATANKYPTTIDAYYETRLLEEIQFEITAAELMQILDALGLSMEDVEGYYISDKVQNTLRLVKEKAQVNKFLSAVEVTIDHISLSEFTIESIEAAKRIVQEKADKIVFNEDFPQKLDELTYHILYPLVLENISEDDIRVILAYMNIGPDEFSDVSAIKKAGKLLKYSQEHFLTNKFLSAFSSLNPDLDCSQFTESNIEKRQQKMLESVNDFPEDLDPELFEELKKKTKNALSKSQIVLISAFVGVDYFEIDDYYESYMVEHLLVIAKKRLQLNKFIAAAKFVLNDDGLDSFSIAEIERRNQIIVEMAEQIQINESIPNTFDDYSFVCLKQIISNESFASVEVKLLSHYLNIEYASLDGDLHNKVHIMLDSSQNNNAMQKFVSAIKYIKEEIDITEFTSSAGEERKRKIEQLSTQFPENLNSSDTEVLIETIYSVVKENQQIKKICGLIGIKYSDVSGHYLNSTISKVIELAGKRSIIDKLLASMKYTHDDINLSYFTNEQVTERQKSIEERVNNIKLIEDLPTDLNESDLTDLRQMMTFAFSVVENKIVASYLGIDYDSLSGYDRDVKTKELITYAQEHQKIHMFLSAAQYLGTTFDITYFSKERIEKRKRMFSLRRERNAEQAEAFEKVKEKALFQLIEIKRKFPDDEKVNKLDINKLSDVTIEYMADWDSVKMNVEANPDLEITLLKNILIYEQRFLESIEEHGDIRTILRKEGLSLIEFLDEIQRYTEVSMDQSQLFRATDVSVLLNHILPRDKRWKSQFETQTSGGCLSNSYRAAFELRTFGFPDETSYKPQSRTIYGYFTPDNNGVLNSVGKNPPENTVVQYGRAGCRIANEAKKKSTFLFGDSLNNDRPPSPVQKPHYLSALKKYNVIRFWEATKTDFSVPSLVPALDSSYSEIQIHGSLDMTDITSIHLSLGNGIAEYEISEMRTAVDRYNRENPDHTVELVVY